MTGETGIRVREIRCRTRRYRQRYRRQRERRVFSCLTVCSMFLLTGMGVLLKSVQIPGVSSVAGGCSSLLLREGGGAYIVVGIAAFAAGMAVTLICIKCKMKKSDSSMDMKDEEL